MDFFHIIQSACCLSVKAHMPPPVPLRLGATKRQMAWTIQWTWQGGQMVCRNFKTLLFHQKCGETDCFHAFCLPIWCWTLSKVKESWCWEWTILAAVSKSNSQNNFSARTSSPHFWIWLEEMAPCYKEESRQMIFMQIFWTTYWTILVLLSAREFLSTTSLRLKPIIPCQRLKLNLWSKAVCLQEQILTHQ